MSSGNSLSLSQFKILYFDLEVLILIELTIKAMTNIKTNTPRAIHKEHNQAIKTLMRSPSNIVSTILFLARVKQDLFYVFLHMNSRSLCIHYYQLYA